MTLLCLIILRLAEKAKTAPRIPVRSSLLQAAIPLALADDLKAGISTTENLMVPKRLSLYPSETQPLAAFGMVCGMVFPMIMFPAAILFGLAELLIPELARCAAAGSRERICYLAKRSLHVTLIYGCLFSGLEFLLAETLCTHLYKTPEASQYLRWYALLIPMLYFDAIADAMIKGLGQQKASVRYNIITSTMDVTFLYLLLPRYGMVGYFFSFLITHLVNFILSIRRLLKIVGNVIDLKFPVLTLLSTWGSIWAAGIITNNVLSCCAYGLIFFCLLTLLGIVGKDDIAWIKGLVYKK